MTCKPKHLLLLAAPLLLTACMVGPKQLGISQTRWDSLTPEQQQQLKQDYKTIKIANAKMPLVVKGKPVKVWLSGGTAKFPPDFKPSAYAPVGFVLQPGTCQQVGMRPKGPSNALTVLKACYSDGVVFFDPSTYDLDKQQASIYIQYQPLWGRGMTYRGISSEGYVGLKNANIRVQTWREQSV